MALSSKLLMLSNGIYGQNMESRITSFAVNSSSTRSSHNTEMTAMKTFGSFRPTIKTLFSLAHGEHQEQRLFPACHLGDELGRLSATAVRFSRWRQEPGFRIGIHTYKCEMEAKIWVRPEGISSIIIQIPPQGKAMYAVARSGQMSPVQSILPHEAIAVLLKQNAKMK
ncbi:Hypothetical predicted protein [Podarcis lilfordi]|uniref:Uncharacterized protein n=1 Tax=Podarcis lilfordi TaxID=74358 RepID=A0AA35LBI0_9SAUR|nr:Hypothetical predicted protein [Podarcis lilfordi]